MAFTLRSLSALWICSSLSSNQSLVPSVFHPFSRLTDPLRGRRSADSDDMKLGVLEQLRRFGKEFYVAGLQRFTQSWTEMC